MIISGLVHQLAEVLELLVGHALHTGVAILAFQRDDHEWTDGEALARALAHDTAVLKSYRLVDHRQRRRFEERNVDMLAVPEGEVAREHRLHRGNRAEQPADVLRERSRWRERFAIGLANRIGPSTAREQA